MLNWFTGCTFQPSVRCNPLVCRDTITIPLSFAKIVNVAAGRPARFACGSTDGFQSMCVGAVGHRLWWYARLCLWIVVRITHSYLRTTVYVVALARSWSQDRVPWVALTTADADHLSPPVGVGMWRTRRTRLCCGVVAFICVNRARSTVPPEILEIPSETSNACTGRGLSHSRVLFIAEIR